MYKCVRSHVYFCHCSCSFCCIVCPSTYGISLPAWYLKLFFPPHSSRIVVKTEAKSISLTHLYATLVAPVVLLVWISISLSCFVWPLCYLFFFIVLSILLYCVIYSSLLSMFIKSSYCSFFSFLCNVFKIIVCF
jgi:hypothetical protein